MASKTFGEDIWKALRAVKVDRKDGIQAPVTANGKDGINVEGVDVSNETRRPSMVRRRISRLLTRR